MFKMSRVTKTGLGILTLAALISTSNLLAAEGSYSSLRSETRNVGNTPLMLSLYTPVEIPWWSDAWNVHGLRLNLIYGNCEDMKGLDVGLVSRSTTFSGLQLSGFNFTDEDVHMTLSLGAAGNWVEGSYTGFQLGGLMNVVKGDATALQLGSVNFVAGTFTGLQAGLVNVVTAQVKNGWQLGLWNHANELDRGGQVGLFNYIRDISNGLQIGLINIIEHNEYPCVPIVNCRF